MRFFKTFQLYLKLFNKPFNVKFRFVKRYFRDITQLLYAFLTIFLLIALFKQLTIISLTLIVLISILFISESLFIFARYKDSRIFKIAKSIWPPIKFLFGMFITIWAMGNANQYIYLHLHENPKNYPLAVAALTSIYSFVNILIVVSFIFYIFGIFISRDKSVAKWFGRMIATFTISIFLFLSSQIILEIFAPKVILHTAFFPNRDCTNLTPILEPIPIALTNREDEVLVFNRQTSSFNHVPCELQKQ